MQTITPDCQQDTAQQLFTEARTHSHWLDKAVTDDTLTHLYELLKWGPTSANCCPARFVFIRNAEGKEKLKPCLAAGNVEQTMTAPVTVIVAYDMAFYDKLPKLFPHTDARSWFLSDDGSPDEEAVFNTAFRNGSLQGAYLMLAARLLGLDCGPMSGFDNDAVDKAFLAGTSWRSNFLCNIGYGDAAKLYPRGPRLEFDEACQLV